MTKGGLSRHLAECPQRQEAMAAADRGKGETQNLYHLKVEDAFGGDFWLHLEMSGTATLKKLDEYLRAIWLECCGHLSEFSQGGRWSGAEVAMTKKADQVFQPGLELMHIYDFGTSSETKITVVAAREGKPTTRHPIALMARNDMPSPLCIRCDEPATHLCLECLYEEGSGMLCATHVKRHPHKEYGAPIPLVNSPRLGMCGYDGPAEPPY